MNNIRFAFRMMLKAPGFTTVAVLTIALGIAINSISFSLFNTVLLQPLPFEEPDRLVAVYQTLPQFGGHTGASHPNFLDWQKENQVFDGLAAANYLRLNVAGDGAEAERVSGASVSAEYFPVLRLKPVLGRTFTLEDHQRGGAKVVVLNHGFWKRRFGGQTNVLGQILRLDGYPYTIIGVLPELSAMSDLALWTPLWLDPASPRGNYQLLGVARLKPGVTLPQARAGMDVIARRLAQAYPEANKTVSIAVQFMDVDRFGNMYEMVRYGLGTTMVAVALVLLIACVNVANLLLARATVREREFAIRAALGAGRGQAIRQLLTENLLLAFMGGGLGLLLTVWGNHLLNGVFDGSPLRINHLEVDQRVLLFTVCLTACTGLIFGLIPALHMSKVELTSVLKAGGQGNWTTGSRGRMKQLLVAAELAMSVVLLVGTGLLTRSFIQVMNIDPGFKADRVLAMRVSLTHSQYSDGAARERFFQQALQEVRTLPGAQSAGLTSQLPMASGNNSVHGFEIEGRPKPPPGQGLVESYQVASAGYFESLSIPLRQGRAFADQDKAGTPRVMLINESMARKYWPDQESVGARLKIAEHTWTVIGVVGDIRVFQLNEKPQPQMYFPHRQFPMNELWLAVRTTGDPRALANPVKQAIQRIDSQQPITRVASMREIMTESAVVAAWQFLIWFMSVFGGLALLLSMIGVYGVISYSVAQRTREFGVRMALGARSADVLRVVFRQGLRLIGCGLGCGLVLALGLSQLLRAMLVNVSAHDPLVFAAVLLFLGMTAALACYLPARRATKVEPMVALRYE